jgi:hypothetical protein
VGEPVDGPIYKIFNSKQRALLGELPAQNGAAQDRKHFDVQQLGSQ